MVPFLGYKTSPNYNLSKTSPDYYLNMGLTAEKLAKKAQEKKITKIFFDRGVYKYHGRVKVFAETLRKNGMEF